jgi:hypothetical protein
MPLGRMVGLTVAMISGYLYLRGRTGHVVFAHRGRRISAQSRSIFGLNGRTARAMRRSPVESVPEIWK